MRHALATSLLLAAAPAAAVAPEFVIQHFGRLLDAEGHAANGQHALKVTFFKAQVGSDFAWEDEFTINVVDGAYSVVLGDTDDGGTALHAADFDGPRWLGVTVDGQALTPRLQVGVVPRALWADKAGLAANAERLGDELPAAFARAADVYAKSATYSRTEADTKFGAPFTEGPGINVSSAGELSVDFGTGADQAARGNHNHDLDYADIGHDHNAVYSGIGHDHNTAYAGLTHAHDSAYVKIGAANSITDVMLADGSVTARALGGTNFLGAIGLPNILAARNASGQEILAARAGDVVTVAGHGFGASPQLRFAGNAVTPQSASDTAIAFVVPAGLMGSGDLVVVNPTSGLRSNPVPLTVPPLMVGSGKDGPGALSGTVVFGRSALTQNAAAGAIAVTVASGPTLGAAAGDLVLVIDLQGTFAGTYEFANVASTGGNTVTLTAGLASAYSALDRVVVQKVPQYTDATLTGTVTAAGFDGTTGGVFAVAVLGTLSFASGASINMDGKGYRGNGTTSGESWNGPGCAESSINNGGCSGGVPKGCRLANQGGGGGIWDTPACPEPSSGGGGHGTAGGDGKIDSSNTCYGQGGSAYGDSQLSKIFFGSAGGRNNNNANDLSTPGASGGSGGGMIVVGAGRIGGASLSARGTAGGVNHHQSAGGGAGGTILVRTGSATLVDPGRLDVSGGPGGTETACTAASKGGDGGAGRVRLDYF